MSDKATLDINGKKYDFPLIKGSENEVAIDIKSLRNLPRVKIIDPDLKTQDHVRVL